MVGVDLGGCGGVAHFVVAADAGGDEPVEVFGDAGRAEGADGLFASLL